MDRLETGQSAPEETNMADATSVSGPVSGTDKTITFTVGVLAPQSQGAVIARIGDTQALATANGAK